MTLHFPICNNLPSNLDKQCLGREAEQPPWLISQLFWTIRTRAVIFSALMLVRLYRCAHAQCSAQQYLVICLFLFPRWSAGTNLIFQDVTADIVLINQWTLLSSLILLLLLLQLCPQLVKTPNNTNYKWALSGQWTPPLWPPGRRISKMTHNI